MINLRLFFSPYVSIFVLCFLIAGFGFPLDAKARDQAKTFSISEAMNTATAKSFEGVDFYFGDQKYPKVERHIGKYSSKKATNAFGKSDWESCEWAFLSAVKSFYERALRVAMLSLILLARPGETNFPVRKSIFVALEILLVKSFSLARLFN